MKAMAASIAVTLLCLLSAPVAHASPVGSATISHAAPTAAPRTTQASGFSYQWVGNITLAGSPYYDSYNPDTNSVWVQESSTSEVAVINDTTDAVTQAAIGQGHSGTGACTDTATHTEWLTSASGGAGYVVVVNDSTYASVNSDVGPTQTSFECAYDAPGATVATGSSTGAYELFCSDTAYTCSNQPSSAGATAVGGGYIVTSYGSGSIATEVYAFGDVSPFAAVATHATLVATNGAPGGDCYDPVNGDFYFANSLAAGNVSVVSSTTWALVGSVNVGNAPKTCAVDSSGNVWVTNYGSDNISVISGTSLIATINGVGSEPFGITYDPHAQRMYVADFGSAEVTVLGSDIQVSFSVLTQRSGIIQPGAGFTQSIYLGGSQMTGVFPSDTIFEATPNSGATKWVAAPVYWQGYWWEPTPNNGTLTIGTSPLSVGIRYDEGSFLTVSETGLPRGVPWWMNATIPGYCQECGVKSTGGAIYQIIQDQPFNYEASSIGNWSWSLNGSNAIDIVPSNPASLVVNFVYTTNLSFSEKGLPSACGVNWGIVVNSGSQTVQQSACSGKLIAYAGNTTGLPLFTNGTTLGYSVVAPSGWTAFPSQGNVTLPDPPTIVFCQSTNSSCLSNETNATGGTGGTGGGSGGSGGGSGSSGGIGGASGVLTQPIDGVPGYGWLFLVVVAVAIVVAFISSRKGGKR